MPSDLFATAFFVLRPPVTALRTVILTRPPSSSASIRDGSGASGGVRIVEQARRVVGCLDVAIRADLLDPGRVNIFER